MWKTIKKSTKLKIYELLMNDYNEQLLELKGQRANMSYAEYRKKYMVVHNRFSAVRRKINKIKSE